MTMRLHGFNTARQINIYHFGEAKSSTLIGFYASNKLVVFNDTPSQFIKATFIEKYIRVSSAIALLFLIIRFIMLLFIAPIHVINIIYRNRSSIKATSPKLNHLIFLGFYVTVIGMTLYTIVEAWPHTLNINMLSNMCVAMPWINNTGPTLVLGTVCAKTWRMYYIYSLAKRVCVGSKKMADPALCGYVGAFVSVVVLLCLLWTCVDPLRYSTKMIVHSDNVPLPLITITGSCQSTWLLYWSNILVLYTCSSSLFLSSGTANEIEAKEIPN